MSQFPEFRAWDKQNKKMCYELLIAQDDQDILRMTQYWSSQYHFMLGVGFPDSTGKNVYVKDYFYVKNLPELMFIRTLREFFHYITDYKICNRSITVVGNLYENPELGVKV